MKLPHLKPMLQWIRERVIDFSSRCALLSLPLPSDLLVIMFHVPASEHAVPVDFTVGGKFAHKFSQDEPPI
jgi:hypothetical protein